MCGQIQALQKVPVPEGPEEGTGDSRTEHHKSISEHGQLQVQAGKTRNCRECYDGRRGEEMRGERMLAAF